MTLDEAVTAVEATLYSHDLRVDRKRAREDDEAYLLVVLDLSHGRRGDGRVIANGPRLVDKSTGAVSRMLVTDAVTRSERMAPARS